MGKSPDPNFYNSVIRENSSIRESIRSLDESKSQIVLVVSEGGVFRGTVTDGDIRRGLLRGINLDEPIERILHTNPLVVAPEVDRITALSLMQANRVRHLPVLDRNGLLVGLHLLEDSALSKGLPNLMVIMAGGFGIRLRPHTEQCPKPLLSVEGKPMLEHIIERAKAEGFDHFILATHYLGHMIEDYFGNGDRWQVKIAYLREDTPLGTAGALSLLQPRPEKAFVVSNGDVLTDIRYGQLLNFHVHSGAAATMAVRSYEWRCPFGVVKTSGIEIVGIDEKPVISHLVNTGVYVLNPSALDLLVSEEPCDMPLLFERLRLRGGRTVAYAIHEPWVDIGRPEDLKHQLTQTSP